MKFFHIFDNTKERDFLSRGTFFVGIGFVWAVAMVIGAAIFGINWGIDFAGGMEMQVKFTKPVEASALRDQITKLGFDKNQVQQYGSGSDNEWLVRVERQSAVSPTQVQAAEVAIERAIGGDVSAEFSPSEGDRFRLTVPLTDSGDDVVARDRMLDDQQKKISDAVEEAGLRLRRTRATDGSPETTQGAIVRDEPYGGKVKYLVQLEGISIKVAKALTESFGAVEVRRVDFVDATVAEQLKGQGVIALVLTLALILVYVAIRFDLFFAPGAVIALLHDPVGALAVYVIGRMEFDLPSIAALLTVVGYSISHTIVIYDRVRETTPPEPPGGHDFETIKKVVNKAVNDTLNRTINTTLTTVFTTTAVWIFASGSVRTFAACLTVGCIIGAYSSIYQAPTIYLWFRKHFYRAPDASAPQGITREDRERGVV